MEKQNLHLRIVGDQFGAPTFTYDIVDALKDLIHLDIQGRGADIQGIFNYANAGEVTWDNFARIIFSHTGIDCNIESITTEAYGAPAPRPPYSILDCTKISSLLSQPIPHWENALMRYLQMVR